MINLDQMSPKFYGFKVAGSILAGKKNSIFWLLNVSIEVRY
jgi:hypothetical protein